MPNRICFVELPVGAKEPTQSFYAKAFDFSMTDFGPTYSCTMSGDVDLGLQADSAEASRAPLKAESIEDGFFVDVILGRITKARYTVLFGECPQDTFSRRQGVGMQGVDRVFERGFGVDERPTLVLEHVDDIAQKQRIDEIVMEQQNVRDGAAEDFVRESIVIFRAAVEMA